jgi:hypothetical protein
MTTPKSTPPTPPAKRHQRRKITAADVEAIATLITRRRLTETESCIHLGINPQTWFQWKLNPANEARNSKALSRVRAAWIESRCKSIEEVGDGAPGTRRDWRAQAWMLERTLPDRFGTQQPPVQTLPAPIPPAVVNVWMELAYAQGAEQKPGEVVDVQSSKQLVESTEPPAAFPETQPASPMEVWLKPTPGDSAPPPPARKRPTPPTIADKTPGSTEGG